MLRGSAGVIVGGVVFATLRDRGFCFLPLCVTAVLDSPVVQSVPHRRREKTWFVNGNFDSKTDSVGRQVAVWSGLIIN